MKITKGTIIRTIALAVVLLNLLLKALGKPLIDFDEGTVMYWLEYIIEIAVIIVTFWKNNSFSPAAIKADEFLKTLREIENEPEWTYEEEYIEENEEILESEVE
jgi:SPP1 family holin